MRLLPLLLTVMLIKAKEVLVQGSHSLREACCLLRVTDFGKTKNSLDALQPAARGDL